MVHLSPAPWAKWSQVHRTEYIVDSNQVYFQLNDKYVVLFVLRKKAEHARTHARTRTHTHTHTHKEKDKKEEKLKHSPIVLSQDLYLFDNTIYS